MMHKSSIAVKIVGLWYIFASTAFASSSVNIDNIGFGAPSYGDRTTITNVETGAIIYENSSEAFWGRTNAGWVQLSQENAAVVTTQSTVDRIVRGSVSNNGTTCTINAGSGFTVSRVGTGHCSVSFNTAYSSGPVCFCTQNGNTATCTINTSSTTGVEVVTRNSAFASADFTFTFLCVGQN